MLLIEPLRVDAVGDNPSSPPPPPCPPQAARLSRLLRSSPIFCLLKGFAFTKKTPSLRLIWGEDRHFLVNVYKQVQVARSRTWNKTKDAFKRSMMALLARIAQQGYHRQDEPVVITAPSASFLSMWIFFRGIAPIHVGVLYSPLATNFQARKDSCSSSAVVAARRKPEMWRS